ncbi:hypothetical protein Efla_001987 [Eimeria flavescens]
MDYSCNWCPDEDQMGTTYQNASRRLTSGLLAHRQRDVSSGAFAALKIVDVERPSASGDSVALTYSQDYSNYAALMHPRVRMRPSTLDSRWTKLLALTPLVFIVSHGHLPTSRPAEPKLMERRLASSEEGGDKQQGTGLLDAQACEELRQELQRIEDQPVGSPQTSAGVSEEGAVKVGDLHKKRKSQSTSEVTHDLLGKAARCLEGEAVQYGTRGFSPQHGGSFQHREKALQRARLKD